ncbi:MAG: hypothetical protein ABEJ28_00245 [Salinigranum sp.]
MSRFTDVHRDGVEAFRTHVARHIETCDRCGFSGRILGGEWKTHVGLSAGHVLVYHLVCPDCNSPTTIEIEA